MSYSVFTVNLARINVYHSMKILRKKRDGFPSCHELTTKKKILSPHDESNLRPMHSVLHRSVDSDGGVIRRN